MFNRVKIQDDDTNAQCFVWRNTTNEPIQTFQMKAMLFGLNCSPFLAQFTKNFNAEKYKFDYPEAYKAIIRNHYVDDYLDSVDSIEEAISRIKSVIKVHQLGGFKIRGFVCNNLQVLKEIPEEYVSSKILTSWDEQENKQKVLGLMWHAGEDCFKFKINDINESVKENPTKRQVLKTIMSVFDPLGFLTPILIKARILMQNIWKSGIGWDCKIKEENLKSWSQWLNDLSTLEKITINRCYKNKPQTPKSIELHIFNDASLQAYCSVAYIRLIYSEIEFDTSLIFSKARVAPKGAKNITVPRMELLAALLGSRISNMIQQELELEFKKIFYWTDSTTVLQWIQSKNQLKPFIAERVSEILDKTANGIWMWIPTKFNVADQGTRDLPLTFHKESSWFNGPEFLQSPEELWKTLLYANVHPIEVGESSENICCVLTEEKKFDYLPDIEKFSEFYKLLRITAWVKKFIMILRNKNNESKFLSTHDLEWARNQWIKVVQEIHFAADLKKYLGESKNSCDRIRLSKFPIKLDEVGVLRIDGRIGRANIENSFKSPIILDINHRFTKLLIQNLHEQLNHVGVQSIINLFRRTFWIPKMTSSIKRVLRLCRICKRFKVEKVQQQSMGNLPRERFLTHQKTFTATGIDYFGPFYIKHGRKLEQRYGVLFTCLTSRAVHIEIAQNLTTDSCIMAIRRMMSRRGQVIDIFSDNGTNFKGAKNELLEALDELHPQKLKTELLKYGINWRFSPPSAPHFGGCWERLIGCFKKSIESVISDNRNPTDEMLSTIFVEAEHLLNSRPYLKQSDDPFDDLELTPNDVLIPHNINILPASNSDNDCLSNRNWRISQHLIDQFWERFIKCYIPTLILRSKWINDIENLKIGDVVIIKENLLRRDWPIGVITHTFPGNDDRVRVVEVKTAKASYRRPSNKIVKLDLHIEPHNFTIIIEGNLGSGKSTLIESMRSLNEVEVFPEPIEKWKNADGINLLHLMYENPIKWAKRFQKYVIQTWMENYQTPTFKKFKVMERCVLSAENVFTKKLLQSKIISTEDYNEISHEYNEKNVKIDLIVYIKTSPEISFLRVKSRGRFEEEEITLEYIKSIHQLYEDFITNVKSRVITIDGNLDPANIFNEFRKILLNFN